MRRISLRFKFFVLLLGVLVLMLAVSIMLNTHSQRVQAEAEMLEKAQILSKELDAFWTFMEVNENRINTDSSGNYDFKGLYCVVAAKSVSSLFTASTDYDIHYTNLETRKTADSPDEFEVEALTAFNESQDTKEYYALAEYEGSEAFRYTQPLYITESCLKCHGEPAGELDAFGYPKEGMQTGDVAGIVSIVMPVDTYLAGIQNNTTQSIILYAIVIIGCLATVFFGISKLVTKPLARLETVAQQIAKGDFDINVTDIGSKDEISGLAAHFDVMAKELSGFYDQLEGKVDERTAELENAYRELDRSKHQLELMVEQLHKENEFKSDYLAIMSHELRTPLTSIIAFTELWEKDASSKTKKEKSAVLEIKINGQILLNIVDNILEMSRIEAGKIELMTEQVDLVDLFGIVGHIGQPLAYKKGLQLKFEVASDVPVIIADWEKLRRIVENLVSNSIKFTHRNGFISVNANLSDDGSEVLISVSDDGIGIEKEHLASIFEKFEQESRSPNRRYKGNGLGLAVVKELVELHGGRIEVESIHKQGSTFVVAIPLVTKIEGGLL